MKPIKIYDIEIVNPELIHQTKIARKIGYSQSYVQQLLDENNVRNNPDALMKIRNAVVELYSNNIRINTPQRA